MELQPGDLSPAECYKLLIGSVVPRPIAVVSTRSPSGVANIAPFSFFTVVSHAPMALAFSVTGRKVTDGGEKDTLRHVLPAAEGGSGEFVVHIASESYALGMAKAATPLPEEESEFTLAGLTPVPSVVVGPPRIAEAPIAFECQTRQVVAVGVARLIIGEVVHIAVRDDLIDGRGRIDPDRLGAIGRMAGSSYCRTTDRFQVQDAGFFPGGG